VPLFALADPAWVGAVLEFCSDLGTDIGHAGALVAEQAAVRARRAVQLDIQRAHARRIRGGIANAQRAEFVWYHELPLMPPLHDTPPDGWL